MIGAIWAQSLDGVIGNGTDMPWYLPEDLKHFKEITLGHPIIMGRRTWESLPVKPLPCRSNHIVSSREAGDWSAGAFVAHDLPEFEPGTEAWIIGGAQLYEATLDEVDVIERTLIDATLAPIIGPTAVIAPRITEEFAVVGETEWMTSENGRLNVPPAQGHAPSPVRYRYQRFQRKP